MISSIYGFHNPVGTAYSSVKKYVAPMGLWTFYPGLFMKPPQKSNEYIGGFRV
jgi:hypothetical protein